MSIKLLPFLIISGLHRSHKQSPGIQAHILKCRSTFSIRHHLLFGNNADMGWDHKRVDDEGVL